jgi:hypothetical protein
MTVYLHGFRLWWLLAPKVQKGPRELGRSALLVVRAQIGFRVLGLHDGTGRIMKLWGCEGLLFLRRLLSFRLLVLHGSGCSATRTMLTTSVVVTM